MVWRDGDLMLADSFDIRKAPIGTPESVMFSTPGGGGVARGCKVSGGVCVTDDRCARGSCNECVVEERFKLDVGAEPLDNA